MPKVQSLALEHQRKRNQLAEATARSVVSLWRSISVGDIDSGWDQIAPEMERRVSVAQMRAASTAEAYTGAAFDAQDMPAESGAVNARAFAGATIEGREIAPELFAAATTTKTLIGRGVGVGSAFHSGAALLHLLTATMVRDAGVMADKVSTVKRGGVRLARVVSPGACSRCAILAGVGYFTKHFERHPHCRCSSVPVKAEGAIPEGVFASPEEYFRSLSPAEQDKVFTKAGAESIRLGADPIAVVNARRGMYRTRQPGSLVARATPRTLIGPDGKPFQAYTTVEGTTRRGWFGGGYGGSNPGSQYVRNAGDRYRRTQKVRIMPETVLELSGGDREKAVDLLRQYGYIR